MDSDEEIIEFSNTIFIDFYRKWLDENQYSYMHMSIDHRLKKSKKFEETIGVEPHHTHMKYVVTDKNKFFLAKIKFGF
jgi:hypothetical protein